MATFRFVSTTETPPGMYRYFVPETKVWFRNFLTIQDLKSAIRQHYKSNQLPCPDDLDSLVADQLCPNLPPEKCFRVDGQTNKLGLVGGSLHFNDVVEGTKNILSWQLAGRPRVPLAEADRRAGICSRCHYNQQPSGCATCHSPLMSMVGAFVANKPTAFDSYLKACRVCKCSLKIKVWFPLDILLPRLSPEKRDALPDFCWLKSPP